MILEFDEATNYLTELLSKCDAGVIARCINIAAHARNTTGTPPEFDLEYAQPQEEQRVRLRRNPPFIKEFVDTVHYEKSDGGSSLEAHISGPDSMFVRILSWNENHPPDHTEALRIVDKLVRVTVEEI